VLFTPHFFKKLFFLGKGGVFGVSTINHHKECCVWVIWLFRVHSNKMMEVINIVKATQHKDIRTLTNFTKEAM